MKRNLTLDECLSLLKPLEKLGYIDSIVTEDNVIMYHITNYDNQNPEFADGFFTDTVFDFFWNYTKNVFIGMAGNVTVIV